jgi:uncharacterized protein (DUF58 family)
MTSLLDPALLDSLKRSRLLDREAEPRHGIGERRSRAVGPGIEFADYRDYQAGDDFRYLDRHVYERLGRAVVRQFTVEQRIAITVLIDASASMSFGTPRKFDRAVELAAVVAAVGAYGGDQVDVATCTERRVSWHPKISSSRGLPHLFKWLQHHQPAGALDLEALARSTAERRTARSVLVVISDWTAPGVSAALRQFRASGHSVIALHVTAPDEADPALGRSGTTQLVDCESGAMVEITLDPGTLIRYRTAFDEWTREIRDAVTATGGRWLSVSSDAPLRDVVLRTWRSQGLIS